jgi:hypothetical protein
MTSMNSNVFTQKASFDLAGLENETVDSLYAQLEQAGLFLRSWHFPSREVVVRTSGPNEGTLRVDVFDFRAQAAPMITVTKEHDQLVIAFSNTQAFGSQELKIYMAAVLRMHSLLPVINPNAVAAPASFCAKPDLRKE